MKSRQKRNEISAEKKKNLSRCKLSPQQKRVLSSAGDICYISKKQDNLGAKKSNAGVALDLYKA